MIDAHDRTFVRLIAELARPSLLPNNWTTLLPATVRRFTRQQFSTR